MQDWLIAFTNSISDCSVVAEVALVRGDRAINMPAKKTTAKKAVGKAAEQKAPVSTTTTTTAEKESPNEQVGKETKENALFW